VLDCLPPFVRKFWSPPLVAWKYVKTSGQEFFSFRELGRSVHASQVNKVIHSGCACFHFPNFIDSHDGHVISANLNILSRPSLIELFTRGTKFRSGFLSMLSIDEAIDKGLKKFVNKQEELLGVQGILSEWKAKVLLFVQKWTCASFVVQTSSGSSLSVPLGDLIHLKILQQSLVITYMDKCCNNFVFVCKKFYVSSIFSELNSPGGTYVVSNLAQSDILKLLLSFNKAHNFKGVKCGPCLPFLCAVWTFDKNPIKPRFSCATSSTSLTALTDDDVSKWLCSFFKAMFPTVNDLWVSKLKKADVPCDSSWILNDSIRVVEVINKFNLSRSEIDKASPLLLHSFHFSTLYTEIDRVDLKARMRVLINKVFNRMLKLHCFKFLMVQKTALNLRFLWLKNKAEINLFENLHSFKVAEASDLISWLDFLLDNFFLCFGQGVYRQCIGIPMGTNCAVFLANFCLLAYEIDFIKRLLKSNTCPVVLHRLPLVRRFVDDLFVPDFPFFVNFMYLNQNSFGSSIYPKTSCELNCTSKGFSCNFLDLAVRQSLPG
jgi:hypothetical protein